MMANRGGNRAGEGEMKRYFEIVFPHKRKLYLSCFLCDYFMLKRYTSFIKVERVKNTLTGEIN